MCYAYGMLKFASTAVLLGMTLLWFPWSFALYVGRALGIGDATPGSISLGEWTTYAAIAITNYIVAPVLLLSGWYWIMKDQAPQARDLATVVGIVLAIYGAVILLVCIFILLNVLGEALGAS